MSDSIVGRLIAMGWKEGPGGVLQPAASSPALRCSEDKWGARYAPWEGYSTFGGALCRVTPPAGPGEAGGAL